MANPIEAVVRSVLLAPRRQALLLPAAAPSVSECRSQHNRRNPPRVSFFACSAEHAPRLPSVGTRAMSSGSEYVEGRLAGENTSLQINMEREARIRKYLELENPEYLPSSYDTAWVAMVPLPGSYLRTPCFPQCVEWILQNQHGNGSWGVNEFDLSVNKDILLSTLACVIALKKWNVGSEQIRRGLQFIATNFSIVMDEQIAAPIGFHLTFPALVSLAIRMGLEFPATETSIDGILRLRDMELKRLAGEKSYGKEAYLAYVAEGLVSLLDWNVVMKFQRKNGSLFNSPAATAAALVHNYDDKALQYLDSIVNIFGSAVPTVYPLNIYSQLSMVDTLEKIGISRHFSSEIKSILDKTYIFWSQRDEEVMLDVATCAIAFRLLRMNGYDVSSDELSHVAEASTFHNSLEGYLDDTKSLLELYKASKVSLSENEPILEKIGCWSGSLLNEKLCSDAMQRIPIFGEVEYALKFPFYATVEPLDHKRNIEHFDARVSQKLKTKNLPCHFNQDLLALAVEDFSFSQSIYQDELQQLESWEKENKLDQLQFVRKNLTNSYLSAAATISPHELSDARVACAKSIALTLVADDFFDVGGSKEELENLISLVEKWDQHHKVEFYSEHVKVVFSAIYTTVNQLGAKASAVQNRDVTKYVVESWLDYLRSLATDAEWQRSKYVPTMEEYMTNSIATFALGPIILIALFFVGQNLWEDIVKDPEYNELFRLMSTCGRLQNDTQSFERECKDGKLNSVSLIVLHSGGSMSIEAAKKKILESIASYRRDLLRLVLREDSVIPRPCKEMFWRLYKTSHVFYSEADGFSSPKEMMGALNAVINEPLKLEATSPSLADQLKNNDSL
ncbi:9-beta-pimara-7,15-diene synthase, chloroplastic-like isoform X1 [Phragmites australis]|uniref:9-beta-pimara-7,15-diene synthase, chloroplastic-like isoform X1 n=1 Tax=Phragmites australis TaxID=29695 RepID=UPI002D777416|nr:9-beta-pimara-7,15-diene synthase, chloroplastic-like isoform X1 [Phragmites australis]